MDKRKTFSQKIIEFNGRLAKISLRLPKGIKVTNPFNSSQKELVNIISKVFYNKFYNDYNERFMILGSSPARRGTAITGIPFEDAANLQKETGIRINEFYINKSFSGFLYDVIEKYGGNKKFYLKFYMNFVCPLGISKINSKGKEVNCNYYDNKELQESLNLFILNSLKEQIKLGINTSICYCIGSGENYQFLSKLNKEHKLFNKIIALEHPRFIMQYNSHRKEEFIQKYLKALNEAEKGIKKDRYIK